MDEMNWVLPSSLESALNEYYTVPQPDPAFAARLEAQLRRRPRPENPASARPEKARAAWPLGQAFRARPVLAVLAAILALLTLTGVVYALGRVTGFIPGFGFTSENGSVLVLGEPVEATVDGIQVQVLHAVSDEERFWVEFSSSAASEALHFPQVFLLQPDGQKIQFIQGENSAGENGSTLYDVAFPPLQNGLTQVELDIQELNGQEFTLALQLRPVRAGEVIPAQPQSSDLWRSESRDGVSLVLDHLAEDPGKTVFQVSLQFDQPNTWVNTAWDVILNSEDGKIYPLSDVTPPAFTDGNTRVYQTVPFSGNEHLVLKLTTFPASDSLPMMWDTSAGAPSFIFDPGADPQVGQAWELDQTLSAGGFTLKVVRASLETGSKITFELEPSGTVSGVSFFSPDPLLTSSSSGGLGQDGLLTGTLGFSRIPDHPFEVRLSQVFYRATGSWEIHWQPPAAAQTGAEIPTATLRPTWTIAITPTASINDPLYLQVQQLAQQADAPFQKGPAWVHEVVETSTNPQSGVSYPPPYIRSEYWFEIDADGYITRSVTQDLDDTGQVIQQTASVGNYAINFTFGGSGFDDSPAHRVSLDLLTRDLAAVLQDSAAQVTQEETTCEDGASCLLVTLQSAFPAPAQNPGEEQAFSGSGRRVWIDLHSGLQVKSQSFWSLAGGGEQVTSTTQVEQVEKVDTAPQKILEILSQVVVP